MYMSIVESHTVERLTSVNGIHLHIVETGEGIPVLLLHGFPEFWYSWRHQLRALSKAGFRAIAPDLRGYNESDRPTLVSSYRTNTLVADIRALIEQLNSGPVYVVGHDWGGIIAWRLAATYPSLVRKLAILNAAHPSAFRRELRRNPAQWVRSFYVLLFQLPWLPEKLLSARNFKALEHGWRSQPFHPGTFTAEDIECYKQAARRSGLTGPLNYYRAAFRYARDVMGEPQTIQVPTLIIWGERDAFMSKSVNDDIDQWVPDVLVYTIQDASHWVQNDTPEQVNELLISFFATN